MENLDWDIELTSSKSSLSSSLDGKFTLWKTKTNFVNQIALTNNSTIIYSEEKIPFVATEMQTLDFGRQCFERQSLKRGGNLKHRQWTLSDFECSTTFCDQKVGQNNRPSKSDGSLGGRNRPNGETDPDTGLAMKPWRGTPIRRGIPTRRGTHFAMTMVKNTKLTLLCESAERNRIPGFHRSRKRPDRHQFISNEKGDKKVTKKNTNTQVDIDLLKLVKKSKVAFGKLSDLHRSSISTETRRRYRIGALLQFRASRTSW